MRRKQPRIPVDFFFLFFAVYYLISIISCKDIGTTYSQQEDTTLPRDFIEFYKHFHQDSTYQISHIVFPLTSIVEDSSGLDSTVTWTSANWQIHRQLVPDDLWAVDFTMPFKGTVVEFVHARQGPFWIERRFARMDTTWRMIYYQGLRMGD